MTKYDVNTEVLKIKYAFERVKMDMETLKRENLLLIQRVATLERQVNKNSTKIEKKEADDLTKIEGIGPKIKSVLARYDISTFAELAKASNTKLRNILDENSLQYHDPKTWPKQAKLADKGKWEELKIWQDELKGGKE